MFTGICTEYATLVFQDTFSIYFTLKRKKWHFIAIFLSFSNVVANASIYHEILTWWLTTLFVLAAINGLNAVCLHGRGCLTLSSWTSFMTIRLQWLQCRWWGGAILTVGRAEDVCNREQSAGAPPTADTNHCTDYGAFAFRPPCMHACRKLNRTFLLFCRRAQQLHVMSAIIAQRGASSHLAPRGAI